MRYTYPVSVREALRFEASAIEHDLGTVLLSTGDERLTSLTALRRDEGPEIRLGVETAAGRVVLALGDEALDLLLS
jgi:hypothetical protein